MGISVGLAVDLDVARKFLAALDFDQRLNATHSFQTFPDWKKPSDRQARALTSTYFGALDDIADKLVQLNGQGASVHVAVNQMAGPTRAGENVQEIRALCADWDGVETYRHAHGYTVPKNGIGTGPEPSIVVRTPRGTHWYWLLHRRDVEDDFALQCEKWVKAQKAIIRQYDADRNVCSLGSTLRVPGFFHHKQHPLDAPLFVEVTKELVEKIKTKEVDLVIGSPGAYQAARDEYARRGGEFAPVQMVYLEKCDPTIRYEMGRLIRGLDLKLETRPQVTTPAIERFDKHHRIKRCRAMLESIPPAVQSDHGGSGNAWGYTNGVCGIGGDFGLDPSEFFPLLCQSWNTRCQPPWEEDELWDKLLACHRTRKEPFGYRLEEESPEYKRKREEWEKKMARGHEAQWAVSMAGADEEASPRRLVKIEGEQQPEDVPFFEASDEGQGKSSSDGAGGGGRNVTGGGGGGSGRGGGGGGGGDGRDPYANPAAPELWKLNSVDVVAKGPDQITMSHLGNAERFMDEYKDVVHYVKTFDRWYVWNGKRWRLDVDAEETHVRPPAPEGEDVEDYVRASEPDPFDAGNYVLELSKRVARKMHTRLNECRVNERDDKGELVYENNKPKIDQAATVEKKKKWIAHCLRTESENGLKQMLNLAKADREIARFPSYFDPYDYLINTDRGVLNLRTGSFYEHHPGFSQSKIVHISPKRSGCPTWTKFLDRVLDGNDDLIRFVQKSVGYSLTGDTREQVLFLLYGLGRNGKSTFLNCLHDLTGEYAQHAEFSTFIERQSDVVRNDLARLHKSRLVTAVEPKSTGYLDEAVIKQVTGQDTVTARFLFQEHFEYKPRFKIWLASNHKPMIRGNDEGIWRRILMIPFTVTIPEEEKDPQLPRKISAELPAIFQWAADGAKLWYEEGLQPPEIVREATKAYREEMDSIGMFITMRCVMIDDVRAMASALYRHYVKWTDAAGEHALSQKKFGMRLEERGFHRRRTKHGYEYLGIAIREDGDAPEAGKTLYDE